MISQNVYDSLVKFRNGPVRRPEEADEMIRFLEAQGYIQCVGIEYVGDLSIRSVEWSVSILGEGVLSEFERSREQEAERKKQQSFQNKVSVASVLVPLVTFILGLFVEHYAGIAEFLLSSIQG